MIKLLAVCGNGMGTSTMMKIKAKKILDSHKIECQAENCSVGQAKSIVNNYDVVIASTHLISQLKARPATTLVSLKNIMDAKEMEARLLEVLK
ncbi:MULTISPECIES: PTS sugar transporter subunit IIB [Psychrilyobacter]|uniref:PTS sugar transporter subunit IIB n=1 Tax=Psychrilyobacter piezotolerans TaxID=2293438 RepID=A0ABX9KG91_9FUSO|nr:MULTISPECIES: PTS sugar transporter subunit IIB [Psychrilyobacter]MCS5422967.1 PTS sugar transporter subunit IIB [Psychrilyobacter sp. S5]RDE61396.1 PTS sugar transporter subunit IIB [Psychrilyobacter sp. S5]REI40917.1 PTS sugar transporter subunit IIB [Psychrilyobacter piezotolerans]